MLAGLNVKGFAFGIDENDVGQHGYVEIVGTQDHIIRVRASASGVDTPVRRSIPSDSPLWDGLKDRRMRWVNVFGRLKTGVSPKRAQATL